MNHNRDIDDGFDAFADEQIRRQSEQRFIRQTSREKPLLFPLEDNRVLSISRCLTIHLVGPLRPSLTQPSHPYDFEEGYCEGWGVVLGSKTAQKTNLRWRDYGARQDLTVSHAG